MQKIPVSKATEGMVLAKAVTRDSGLVLMGEGTALTDTLLQKLHDLEIKNIFVKGKPLGSGDEKTLEQLYAELEERFSTVAENKLCSQIKAAVKKDITRRKQEEDI